MKRLRLILAVCLLGICGCSVVEFATPEKPPLYQEITAGYYSTSLDFSNSSDVLRNIALPEEIMSQTPSVIATFGEKKKGYKAWLKMVAFDENDFVAKRKYLFIEDEKPKTLFTEPRAGARFDCEMIMDDEVLDEPFANDKAKRIAVLKKVLENTQTDLKEVRQDNKQIDVCGMMINQILSSAITELEQSPAMAKRLSDPNGLAFTHRSYGNGKIRMNISGNLVDVKCKLGSNLDKKYKVSREQDMVEM